MTLEQNPLIRQLVAEHPALFRGEPPYVWSFVTGGWYPIVDELCSEIEVLLGPSGCADFSVVQVKEKFASLSFYYRYPAEETPDQPSILAADGVQRLRSGAALDVEGNRAKLRTLVDHADERCAATCQRCGAPGHRRNLGGWLATLCDEHANNPRD